MATTTVLFDLDGTLLPMDPDIFVKAYFKKLAVKLMPYGYDSDKLIKAIWAGTAAMIKNNGEKLNEEVFWDFFCSVFGEKVINDKSHFEDYYKNDFQSVREACGFNVKAASSVFKIKAMGLRTVLATNPIFPAIATESRIRWAGLSPEDFEYYTTYENSRFCKPNPKYYEDILSVLDLKGEECIMVGNDVDEDMVAEKLGMKVFLLTDNLINKSNKDISIYPHGNFDDLINYVESL